MTDTVERAVEALRKMPPLDRESMAQAIITLAEGGGSQPLDIEPEHMAAVMEGLAQIERGEYATDDAVEAAYRSYGA